MKKIILMVQMVAFYYLSQAQFTVRGKITDEGGVLLTGANVQILETQQGAVTNLQGTYEINLVEKGNYQLVVSFVGYEKVIKPIEVTYNITVDVVLTDKAFMAEEVIVSATRAGNFAKGTVGMVTKNQIQSQNMGQDLPYLMSLSPSLVSTSDAGFGVGYTGFRIRGTDANRINVSVNGIPLNDAESHGVFWVNMPDFANSVENIEIQRGVGTSSNGAAAFGATINMQTNHFEKEPFAEISSTAGSFNTFKNSIKVGSGLLKNHFAFEARLSKISSDGFIDRAFSDLSSWFVSGGYYSEKTLLKFNYFSGKEKTYQAWNGIPKVRLENDTTGMIRYGEHGLYTDEEVEQMLHSNSRTYNLYTYSNETDNYQQDHSQLIFSHQLSPELTLNAALHYTYGSGYYEQFKIDDDLADYNIPPFVVATDTLFTSDIIRQKWLDNDFYGAVFSLNYSLSPLKIFVGGGINQYDGRHFGKVIWGNNLGDISYNYEWYRSTGKKTDANGYVKLSYQFTPEFEFLGDVQYRYINHSIKGFDDNNRDVTQDHQFHFINPKMGLKYKPTSAIECYLFYANGHREPIRSNFTDTDAGQAMPKAESMHDFELGTITKFPWGTISGNAYYMYYIDQLVLTGLINNVGSSIMTNVDKSYRAGVELMANVKLHSTINWEINMTFSRNKIEDFTEYVDDWDQGGQLINRLGKTDIAFSPAFIGNSLITIKPFSGFEFRLITQAVGKQFIDNTSNEERKLDPYMVHNIQLSYSLHPKWIEQVSINLQFNNVLNAKYESNAWVYSYFYENQRWAMDGYFPQAGFHVMGGVNIRF